MCILRWYIKAGQPDREAARTKGPAVASRVTGERCEAGAGQATCSEAERGLKPAPGAPACLPAP